MNDQLSLLEKTKIMQVAVKPKNKKRKHKIINLSNANYLSTEPPLQLPSLAPNQQQSANINPQKMLMSPPIGAKGKAPSATERKQSTLEDVIVIAARNTLNQSPGPIKNNHDLLIRPEDVRNSHGSMKRD